MGGKNLFGMNIGLKDLYRSIEFFCWKGDGPIFCWKGVGWFLFWWIKDIRGGGK